MKEGVCVHMVDIRGSIRNVALTVDSLRQKMFRGTYTGSK